MWLVVGLGNPGKKYERSRHNLGFVVVDVLRRRAGDPAPRERFGADLAEIALAGARALTCKPMEFMNVSGRAVARVAQFWKVSPDHMIVVHDELDLPLERIRLGRGGGHGGHNGLRSIIADWGTADFLRVRVGVGRPPAGHDPASYLLSDFGGEEVAAVPAIAERAAEAVTAIVEHGLTAAMNRFNAQAKSGES
jgi:PTH1 family peptidyl-tRNA hydrolase